MQILQIIGIVFWGIGTYLISRSIFRRYVDYKFIHQYIEDKFDEPTFLQQIAFLFYYFRPYSLKRYVKFENKLKQKDAFFIAQYALFGFIIILFGALLQLIVILFS